VSVSITLVSTSMDVSETSTVLGFLEDIFVMWVKCMWSCTFGVFFFILALTILQLNLSISDTGTCIQYVVCHAVPEN